MKRNLVKPVLPALILPFLALNLHAQTSTGTAHPEQLNDVVQTDHYVKPSHEKPSPAVPAYQDSYPATAAEPKLLTHEAPVAAAPAAMPAAQVGAAPAQYAPQAVSAPVQTAAIGPAHSPDEDIVLAVPGRPHEINRGTVLHARLREDLNTQTTAEDSVFTAELLKDVAQNGEVMLPAGSLIRGHVTSVHGGKRISGGASIHLRPETVSLPDGTLYRLDAQVTDLTSTQDLRVNNEGSIVLRSNPKAAAAVVGGVTGTGAVAGALLGGGVGAAVGAVAGAGVATAVYLKRDVQENLPVGTDIFFALNESLPLTPR